MRIFSATALSVLLLLAGTQQLVFMALYQINKTAVTEKYCENKSKPAIHCDGKCHLKKTIARSEKEDTKNQTAISFKMKEVEIISQKISSSSFISLQNEFIHTFIYQDFLPAGFSATLLKPPAFLG